MLCTNVRNEKKILYEITFFSKNLLDFSTPPTIVSPEPEISCGIQEKSKVLGGDNATLGAWPWAAALGSPSKNRNNWNELQVVCGGTLIKENYVLTAAHCFYAGEDNPTLVRLGDLDITTDTDGANHEDIKIQRAIVHPG